MTIPEMEQLKRRNAFRAEAAQRLDQWAATRTGIQQYERAQRPHAFAFWYSLPPEGSDLGADVVNDAVLTDVVRSGLRSAVEVGGLNVFLLTYGHVPNVLDGIYVADASDYMDVAVFKNALRRVPLPLLADFIRLKAMAASHAPLKWFLDGDVLWVADVRERIQCPHGVYDHLFSSMDAPRSQPGSTEIYEKHWALY